MDILAIHPESVALIPLEEEAVSEGGIVLPDSASTKPPLGTVTHVGSEVPVVKVGDVVLHNKYAGTPTTLGSDKYIIMGYRDILAVVE